MHHFGHSDLVDPYGDGEFEVDLSETPYIMRPNPKGSSVSKGVATVMRDAKQGKITKKKGAGAYLLTNSKWQFLDTEGWRDYTTYEQQQCIHKAYRQWLKQGSVKSPVVVRFVILCFRSHDPFATFTHIHLHTKIKKTTPIFIYIKNIYIHTTKGATSRIT